jgi:NAD(P)H-hydrate epimerase
MAPESAAALEHLLASGLPLLLDADALNLIARQGWQERIPKNAVLTPHPKEFERLFGPSANGFERLARQRQKAMDLGVVILLKGAFSAICLPDGSCHFNSSGNPGMATAGSGDVLSGIISGLLAQGYAPAEAAILGAYLHGRAGDLAAAALGQQALIAGDIIEYLGAAFLE